MVRRFDLRSDTVTRPTAAMREAMRAAEVDDDAYGDDAAVGSLERRVAALLGHDAGLWLPTGTMANQLAVALHCPRGSTVACSPGAHVRIHEDASAAALSGVQLMSIGDRTGFDADELDALVDEESCGWPPLHLVWLENTLGEAGGAIWPLHDPRRAAHGLQAIADRARGRGKPLHLDGARLWNAHVATGIEMHVFGALADTVSVSLSKGLGAPAGSVLCGSDDRIATARRLKHALGGAMRQAPAMLAAAGHYALDHHIARLRDDHRRARALADAIADLPHWQVTPPQTNLVLARVQPPLTRAEPLCAALREAGVACYPNIAREVRLAVHLGLDDADIAEVATIIRATLGDDPTRFTS
ncbi:MAG: aminotransferase class I/II-fold pyridoxal phosphate-dependent enzyme [Deltaproteobacteria bacterium]|nr:aminotransferase class I/II-fold pyridoxal phosphate-dependent enzyme [Deltaproteobacteria bacterium]MBK8720644.1 aminotransferase class I/II-fold pyridoxal phosphate-dependent enzyme [Deltaproteobacteria bacterium]MBP7290767.1 aminotransferase class I/II-fold pyridoxal phosphate-dependent enzyme [Nannocystaceae bacterium]